MLRSLPITENFADMTKVELLAAEAFPPEEYLSPSKLIEMAKDENFDFSALYDGDEFVGFMAAMTHENMAYLLFLAIEPALRSNGCGAKALALMRETYPGMQQVVDMEMLDDSADNNPQRERRRRFYMRNGYKPTGHFLSYLGVDYEIFCAGDKFDFETFKELMKRIKVDGFVPEYFNI